MPACLSVQGTPAQETATCSHQPLTRPCGTRPQARCHSPAAGCRSPLPTPGVWPGQTGATKGVKPLCFLLSQHPKAPRAVGWGCVLWDQAQPSSMDTVILPWLWLPPASWQKHSCKTWPRAAGSWGADGAPQDSPLLCLLPTIGPAYQSAASQHSSACPAEPITLSR